MTTAINRVRLQGNLTHDPRFDIIPGSGTEFLLVYVAVSRPAGIAEVDLRGNVAQPPHFQYVGDEERPFMRIYLAIDRTGPQRLGQPDADFARVVAYDDAALFTYPYLIPGSDLLVTGVLRSRRRRLGGGQGDEPQTETVIETVVDDGGFSFLQKINWEAGDSAKGRLLVERRGQPQDRPERLHGGGFFRVVAYGSLARTCYPYLMKGSEVFVHGRLRVRRQYYHNGSEGKTVVEVVARNIRFLRNINWEAGDLAGGRVALAQPVAETEEVECFD
jgi:single-stranded DNA-binding protein